MMLKRGAFYRLSKKSKIRTPCCIKEASKRLFAHLTGLISLNKVPGDFRHLQVHETRAHGKP
jgi:hypothetical protein